MSFWCNHCSFIFPDEPSFKAHITYIQTKLPEATILNDNDQKKKYYAELEEITVQKYKEIKVFNRLQDLRKAFVIENVQNGNEKLMDLVNAIEKEKKIIERLDIKEKDIRQQLEVLPTILNKEN
jgi:transcription initiation factor IIF auxiliary subunit